MSNINIEEDLVRCISSYPNCSIMLTDAEGRILFCSDGTCAIMNMARDELVGTTLQELQDTERLNNSSVLKCIETKKPANAFLNISNNDNHGTYANSYPFFDEKGELYRVLCISMDESTLMRYTHLMENIYKKRLNTTLNQMMRGGFRPPIANSPNIQSALDTAFSVASLDTPVLIYGESGTGKELMARYIYKNSSRKDNMIVSLNCGAMPENLIESELFGYEKGAFTGAEKSGKIGLLELADKGTLFLDEIGELPLSLQPKLLRFLETGEIRRLGGTHEKKLDVRIIAATNRNLWQMVSENQFRLDLYYRLSIFPINLPPLRNREADILPLAEHFLSQYNHKYHKAVTLNKDFISWMHSYNWPGNVREMQNLIQRYVITDGKLSEPHITMSPAQEKAAAKPSEGIQATSRDLLYGTESEEEILPYKEFQQTSERRYFETILKKAEGNMTRAAYLAGCHISSIYKKLDKLGIDPADFR